MEITAPAAAALRHGSRFTFLTKLACAFLLVSLGDFLFFLEGAGSTVGIFVAALLVAVLVTRPAIGKSPAALAAAGAALVFAASLGYDPSLLGWALFWCAASLAAMLPRVARFDDGWRWARRLLVHALLALFAPVTDLRRIHSAKRRRGNGAVARAVPMLLLPLGGTLLFLFLFSTANPLIGDALREVNVAFLIGGFSILRLFFWLFLGVLVWSMLRPAAFTLGAARERQTDRTVPGVSPGSVAISLVAFNALFGLQNGLDIAFLWGGANLPDGMTLAEYAHRGAYPLIATALLAGLFVLVTLRPGSETAASPFIRRLVYLWIAQNVFLVASTMLRTLDYIEAYSLTSLRIAALAWMTLVAIGLILVCVRLWRGKSGAWLINANLAAALIALSSAAFVDLGAAAAQWNVRHAREAGGRGAPLDLCYLHRLGPSALLALVEIESRPVSPQLRDRAAWVRNVILDRLEPAQANWRLWTIRNHRRLHETKRLATERRLPRYRAGRRRCDARPIAPAPLDSRAGEV